MKKLCVDASIDGVDQVKQFVGNFIDEAGCTQECRNQIMISVEEIFVNIFSYAYDGKNGNAEVSIDFLQGEEKTVEIIFSDGGIPFNPLEKPDPDITEDGRHRKIGGLGIYLVKKTMDHVEYCRDKGRNVLKIRHHLK